MKPSIVFSHGIWADGSCFQKLIPTLRAEGHQVLAAQYGLDTLKGDVDATIRTFGASPQNACAPRPSRLPPAMTPCSPTPESCST
jgi:hypothetical protein